MNLYIWGKKGYIQTLRHIPSMINKELMTMVGRNKIDEFGIQLRLF